jgi:hypothetical protein
MAISRFNRLSAIAAAMVLAYPMLCAAQTVNPPTETRPQIVPEDTRPGMSGSSHESLSKTLSRTDGVLHPPQGVDPGVTVPAPSTGSNMPVIPPPGTPGSNSAIEPK